MIRGVILLIAGILLFSLTLGVPHVVGLILLVLGAIQITRFLARRFYP